jgi:hypothetical protein
MSSLAFLVRCPQCPTIKQGISTPIARLKQMLEAGEEITVLGLICNHVFKLSAAELEELRNIIALQEKAQQEYLR